MEALVCMFAFSCVITCVFFVFGIAGNEMRRTPAAIFMASC